MKICALLGSPRKAGNTACVLEWVLAEAEKGGHQTEVTRLYDKSISGCVACFACEKVRDRPGCVVEDDMQDIYRQILAADCIVIASPVYCYWFAGPVKLVLDRFYALMKQDDGGGFRPLIKGKRCGLVVTAGSDESGGADLVLESYRRIASGFEMRDAGHIVLTEIARRDDLLKPEVEEAARRLGRSLTDA